MDKLTNEEKMILIKNANVDIDDAKHEVSLQIPYVYEDNGAGYYHTFSRVISQ